MVTIQVKLLNFTCLPHDHHLAFSVSQPESFKRNPQVNLILEISFSLYGDSWPAEQSWPCQQHLAAFGVPNTTPMFSSLITYYTVPTASCSDAIIRRNEVWHPFSCTYNTKWRQGNTTPTLLYSQKVTVTWLVQALLSKQRYTYPATQFSLSEHDTWSITNFIR